MNDIVKTKAAGVPSAFVQQLLGGIAESRASTPIGGGGQDYLRLLKRGQWGFGAENEPVQKGSTWAVNVMSLQHGWNCWVNGEGNNKNELKGEIMVSMTQPKPLRPAPIEGTDYKEQRSFELKCLDGDDAGHEVIYKINSDGGMRAVDALLAEIQKQLVNDPTHPCPVLELGETSYNHPKWGETFKPILTIVGWVDMDGESGDEPALAPPPEPKPAKPVKAAKPEKAPLRPATAPPAPAAPVSTTQAHVGQRRRTRA